MKPKPIDNQSGLGGRIPTGTYCSSRHPVQHRNTQRYSEASALGSGNLTMIGSTTKRPEGTYPLRNLLQQKASRSWNTQSVWFCWHTSAETCSGNRSGNPNVRRAQTELQRYMNLHVCVLDPTVARLSIGGVGTVRWPCRQATRNPVEHLGTGKRDRWDRIDPKIRLGQGGQ